ncbi:MAG: permease [Synechocystis sp.]|nr:permease [Synechocystis sp.]
MNDFVLLGQFVTLLSSALLLSLPWLLLGITLSSTFLIWTDEQKWVANFPRNRLLGSLVGSTLGFLLPVGALGCVPIARRLLLQGAPIPFAVSFLMAAPILNVLTITDILFTQSHQPRLIFLQISLTWLMAIIFGLIFSTYRVSRQAENDEDGAPLVHIPLLRSGALIPLQAKEEPHQRQGGMIFGSGVNPIADFSWSQKLQLFGRNIIEELQEFGGVLVLGTAIAAGIVLFLPQSLLLQWADQQPITQTLVMMGFGFLMPLGSFNHQAFVVPLLDHVWLGASLGCLLLSALLNLQSLSLWLATFRWRPLLYLLGLLLLFVFAFAMITNYYLS